MDRWSVMEALLDDMEWVGRLTRALAGSEDRAQELVQELWLAALRKPPPDGDRFRLWIRRVVKNHLAMERVRARQSKEVEIVEECLAGDGESQSEMAQLAEAKAILMAEIEALSKGARQALVLRFFEEQSEEEIASKLEISPRTARRRIASSLGTLRSRINRRSH